MRWANYAAEARSDCDGGRISVDGAVLLRGLGESGYGVGLNFPDGTYYATIMSTSGQSSILNPVIAFTAKNGVLTVAAITLPNGKAFPLIITANTSSIIALYPRGVIPPAFAGAPNYPTCSITFSTLAPGGNGTGYVEDLDLIAVAIGN